MREGFNATLKHEQKTLTGGNWTKILDQNVQRTYLMIQNDHDAHTIEVGFGTDTVAPTGGFHIEGSVSGNKIKDTQFEFGVAPINAVWAKADDVHDHLIDIIYDD